MVARTWEVGLRSGPGGPLRWSLAWYRTRLQDDILFSNVPGGGLARGFFQNVGGTQREGVEATLHGEWKALRWYASYSHIEATFRSRVTLQNALGAEEATRGDRIPGIPRHLVKCGADYEILPGWFVGGDLQHASAQFVRGDANRLQPIPGYVVLNLGTRYT